MIIKKYNAKTEESALLLAKEELGDGCVLLNSKINKPKGIMKLFKTPSYEITVALEEESETDYEGLIKPIGSKGNSNNIFKPSGFNVVVDDNVASDSDLVVDNKSFSKEFTPAFDKESPSVSDIKDKEDNISSSNNEEYKELNDASRMDEVYNLISQTLIDNEVDKVYVDDIIEDAKNRLKDNTPIDVVLSHIYQRLILRFGEPMTISPASKGPKVVYFVGTTGVGKTTTIAKIASKLYLDGHKVALFTSDTYRIAAAEQLRSYANILSVPFRIIYTIDDFAEGLDDFAEFEYILVDTVGHSHKNEELKADMKKFIDFSKEKAETEVYLVLAASTKMRDLIYISDSYSEITDFRLIFTKLDETYTYGTIFNLRMHTGAPLSYVTYGQNVPEDIDVFKPQQIVKKILGGK